MEWLILIPALIASATTLIVDGLLKQWQRWQESKQSAKIIYRRYADPLAAASEKLLWRFKEIFSEEGWGSYLNPPDPVTDFENYKKTSTIYRLAVVLAWIRALRRELTVLTLDKPHKVYPFNKAILEFESSLADGPHVEIARNESLCKLWELDPPLNEKQARLVGRKVESHIKRVLHDDAVDNAIQLDDQKRSKLCHDVSEIICKEYNIAPVPSQILKETEVRAIRQIAIREAWLYRDWQAGIGDLMIRRLEQGVRRFEVIGYAEFENILKAEEKNMQMWIKRLDRLFDMVDVSGGDRFDARVQQLRNVMAATAQIVLTLAKVSGNNRAVSEETLFLATKIVKKANSLEEE